MPTGRTSASNKATVRRSASSGKRIRSSEVARAATRATPRTAATSHRKLYFLATLVSAMSMTGLLLMVLRGDPLLPDTSRSLLAVDTSGAVEHIFETPTPVAPGRWKYVFIHQSKTPGGNADTLAGESESDGEGLADHFVIGNGDGCGDGAIQVGQRWDRQKSAGTVSGLDRIQSDCISICVVGDLDHAPPTKVQLQRLAQLTTSLQKRLHISADHVWLVDSSDSPAGIGRSFPLSAFRARLLP